MLLAHVGALESATEVAESRGGALERVMDLLLWEGHVVYGM